MELPIYNSKQPGCTYYYVQLDVYNLGVVNHTYQYGNSSTKELYNAHMNAHVYHKGAARNGANKMVSLIMKTLVDSGI